MSENLAKKLMSAKNLPAFLRGRRGADWRLFADLKRETDRLVQSDLNAAARLVDRIQGLGELVSDAASKAFSRASRARLLHMQGRHAEACELYDEAARVLQGSRLRTEAAIVQKQQVDALTHLGRYDEALSTARAARRVLASADEVQLAQLEANVGNVYYMLDRYKKALEHYDRARDMLSLGGDDSMRALVDFSRSNVLAELDRPAEALTLLESAAASYDLAGRKLYAAQTRFHMAYLQFLMGRYNAALEGYYQARERLEQLGSDQLVAWCNLEIAEILLALNAFDEAAENAAAARGKFTELEMPYESAKASLVAGLARIGAGEIEPAAYDLNAARESFAAIGNSTFTAQVDLYLAELAIRKRDADEALRRAGDALRVFARQGLATRAAYAQLIQARAAYDQGERVRAGRLARAALLRVEGRLAPAVAYQCHHLIGVIERARGRSHPALESFRRAVETVERMRGGIAADEFKASFLRDKIEVYEDAIAACLDRGDQAHIDEAFRLVESSKSRALADLLARYLRGSVDQTERPGSKGLEAETRARLLKLVEDLNWYSSQAGLEDDKGGQRSATVAERYRQKIIRCERQIAQLFRRLEASTSRFAEIHGMQSDSARDLCQALEPNETAIEYFTTGDQVSAFVATSDRFQVVRGLASRREVEAILTALRFQVEKFNYGPRFADEHFEQLNGAINRHLIQLYEAVFDRVEGHVGGERLMIIPHGPLHYVPFHALLDRRGYLIDRFEVSYAPSATVLRLCRQRDSFSRARRRAAPGRTSDGKLVALGVADRETPSIELEVQALGSIFSDAVTLTGADATRSNLLKFAPQARFLHLASHGYFRRDNPMFSFLKLADSQLNFYSLLDLKLKAEMVTLSACHTGVNMVFPGDELHGLMRGFLYAGAPSLVASLWAANDVSTAEFMKVMYSQVRAGRSKRAALRAAQLAIKDAYGHPYYWAPFVLMGNPN